MNPKLILIAGPSCSGKTTLASALASKLQNASVLSLDWYYRDLAYLTTEERSKNNFDHPEALEHELVLEHVEGLLSHRPISAPVYDFMTHTRQELTLSISPAPFVLLEGIHALHWEVIRNRAATSVYIDLEHEFCLARRIERDQRERARDEQSIRKQYEATVRPMFDIHAAPRRKEAHVIVRGDEPLEGMIKAVLSHVHGQSD